MAVVNYAAIAAGKIKPANKHERHPRILVYGRNKQGKTRFTGTAPKVLVIDPEGGTASTLTTQDVWPVTNWSDINEAWRYLQTKEARDKYESVGMDGLTRFSNMALRFVMKQQEERDLDRIPGMVQQKDYGKSGELMKGLLYNLHALPYTIIYTAQERMETSGAFDSEDEDAEALEARYVPDLPKGVRSAVNGIVDVIGRIYTVKVEGTTPSGKEVKGIQRRLWVGPSDIYDTGFRSGGKLPNLIKNPTVPRVVELVNGKEAI